ncbi:MAG: lamin tail domain-containing protein, partial [Bacteroidia bacterium]|nr:lamin tail domain-containing protein [Bacteroidia bacterium]
MKLVKPLLFTIALFPVFLFAQNQYDVIIDEFMADPTPMIGLPNNEWLELKNTTTAPINLQNWRIGDLTGQSGPMPNFT